MNESADRAQVYRLFSEAMEIEACARENFVQERCGHDADLLREVAALLTLAETNSGATGLLLVGAEPDARALEGAEYGRFRLQELIGSGGMGMVYKAVRTDSVPQAVAIKLLRGEISRESGARFVSEAKLLARLHHPAIAQLIDVGVKDGEGWLAMELIRGHPIDDYCDAHDVDLRQRVKLLAIIVGAVATAHRSLVVHRDIKPTNVLVDDEGHPKLIDFGIASTLSDGSGTREPTTDIRRLFTPNYAAPEQVKGEPITVATDVFGLGALGYRLLSGRAPFAQSTSPISYLYAVTHQDVEAPSRTALGGGVSWSRQLRGDLDAILMKALERDPERRYASALDFQADLHRYLDGLPVSAHAPSLRYRLAKLARRHALAVTLGAILVLGLIAGGVIYALQTRSVIQARNAALRRGEFLENLLKSADPDTGRRDITVAELLDSATKQLDQTLGREPLVEASMLGLIAETDNGLGRYPEALSANERQLSLLRTHDGGPSELARALRTRGDLLSSSGRHAEAKTVLTEAVEMLRSRSDANSEYASALVQLGVADSNTGGEKEAEALFQEAIAIDRRGSAAMQREVGGPLQALAALYFTQGRYDESVALSRDALAVYRKYWPADYPEALDAEGNYAMTLMTMHRSAEAEPVFRDLIARMTRVRGAEHPNTLMTQDQLAESLMQQQRYAEAIQILRPTAEAVERVVGANHRYSTSTWSDYAIASCSGPDPSDGLATAQRIAAIRIKTLAAGDWRLFSAQANIGFCLVRLQRYAEAEPILLKAAANLEASRGPAFFQTQKAYESLVELYSATGRTPEAEAISGKIQR